MIVTVVVFKDFRTLVEFSLEIVWQKYTLDSNVSYDWFAKKSKNVVKPQIFKIYFFLILRKNSLLVSQQEVIGQSVILKLFITSESFLLSYIYIYIYICVCVCACVYIYICVCVCMHVYIWVYICVCVCIFIYKYMITERVCVCVCARACVCAYVCIYITCTCFVWMYLCTQMCVCVCVWTLNYCRRYICI